MALVKYKCQNCNEISEFETNGARMLLLNDNIPRPATYVVNCDHCGHSNSVTPNQNKDD
ncbi:MAG: hypothetical protein JRE64_20815 [Deltaproteobacteria bacterium]|nr:hypothetical protein [Deltaproteobacteria bacterium]